MSTPVFGKSKKPKKLFAEIEVIVDDTALMHGSELVFRINQNDINTNLPGYTKSYTKVIIAKSSKIIVPLSTAVNYGRIDLINEKVFGDAKAVNRPLTNGNNLFVFENGDKITLHLTAHPNGAFFTGKDALKYTCSYKVECKDGLESVSLFNHYMKIKEVKNAFEAINLQFDSIFKVQSAILNEYKTKLSKQVYKLILLDCWSWRNRHIVDRYLDGVFMMKRSDQYQAAEYLFKRDYFNNQIDSSEDPQIQNKSYQYGDFLIEKEIAYAVISQSNDTLNYYKYLEFKDIIQAINLHHKRSTLKDKLNLLALLSSHSSHKKQMTDFVKYLNLTVEEAGNNRFKTELIAFKNANAIGMNAFPFALRDQNGKIIRLAGFKGKLVIMDFWFTGCGGCLVMSEKLKPIVAYYKSNPNIVFITVSIDKSEKLWLTGIKTEKYCSQDEVNLLASNAEDSLIIQYYNIDAYPTLIAISKYGKILSTAPPDPRINEKSFTTFINQNL